MKVQRSLVNAEKVSTQPRPSAEKVSTQPCPNAEEECVYGGRDIRTKSKYVKVKAEVGESEIWKEAQRCKVEVRMELAGHVRCSSVGAFEA